MAKTYRVGLVGLTGITSKPRGGSGDTPFRHEMVFAHAASLDLVQNAEIAGYCDLVPGLLDQFKATWSERWPGAQPYTDYREMLTNEDLDILAVATSDHRHADITVDGANAGVKGVLCEKPLATSMEDADRMIQACEGNGTVLVVDHSRRWVPLLYKVRETIRSGAIGPLTTIVAIRGGPRAMLFRNGTHMIDEVCFFADSEPTQVWGRLEEGFEHWDQYKGDGGKLPENDPGVSGFIQFQNGVRALYSGTKNTFERYTLQLTGTQGQIFLPLSTYPYSSTAKMLTHDPETGDVVSRTLVADQYREHGLVAAYEELIDVIEKGGTPISSAREARKTVQIILGFLKSQQAGSSLVDVPL